MNYKRLGVIGGGNMAQAIIRGAINQVIWPDEICVADPHPAKLGLLRNQGVKITTDDREAATFGDVILLAVKPQVVESALDEIADLLPGKTVLSIVAGYSRSWLKERLPDSAIICAMPNLPLTYGKGATAISPMDDVPRASYRFASSLFMRAGGTFILPAEKINEVIPVNGSSPAFFFRLVELLAQQAENHGIDKNMAVMMAAQTMAGAAEMIMKSGKSPEALIQAVCSPGGTTLAALSAFDEMGLDQMVEEAYDRCVRRANELGK